MVEINLIDDFKEILKNLIRRESGRLREMHYEQKLRNLDDLDELCLLFFNLIRRLIDPKPRNIKKSKEFQCPTHLGSNLNDLAGRIKNGEDLAPFLSRKLKKLDFPDATLNEWGVYHLHLGGFRAGGELSGGLNEILFTMFDDKNAYFIQIMTHHDWTNKELIEIIHENWPNLIDRFRIKGISVEKTPKGDREKWRKGGINTAIVMDDGTAYMGPGGGMVITQYNLLDKRDCNILIKNLKQIEKDLIIREDRIKSEIQKIKKKSLTSLKFKLEQIIFGQDILEYRIRELNSDIGIAFKGDQVIFYNL